MTLAEIVRDTVLHALLDDKHLSPLDVQLYLHMFLRPLDTIPQHARALSTPHDDVQLSVQRLTKYRWAYPHRKRSLLPGLAQGTRERANVVASPDAFANGRSFAPDEPVIVPWMPPVIEKFITDELIHMRPDVDYFGQWLMKCLLDLYIQDWDYRDNVRPRWLITPEGSSHLEINRWYRGANVAFQFQGYQDVPAYPNSTAYSDTPSDTTPSQPVVYDHLTHHICTLQGVQLVEITAAELQPTLLEPKIAAVFPINPVRRDGPLFRELVRMCHSYIRHASRFARALNRLPEEGEHRLKQ